MCCGIPITEERDRGVLTKTGIRDVDGPGGEGTILSAIEDWTSGIVAIVARAHRDRAVGRGKDALEGGVLFIDKLAEEWGAGLIEKVVTIVTETLITPGRGIGEKESVGGTV